MEKSSQEGFGFCSTNSAFKCISNVEQILCTSSGVDIVKGALTVCLITGLSLSPDAVHSALTILDCAESFGSHTRVVGFEIDVHIDVGTIVGTRPTAVKLATCQKHHLFRFDDEGVNADEGMRSYEDKVHIVLWRRRGRCC
jgi:hypothetical protein